MPVPHDYLELKALKIPMTHWDYGMEENGLITVTFLDVEGLVSLGFSIKECNILNGKTFTGPQMMLQMTILNVSSKVRYEVLEVVFPHVNQ